MAVAVGREDSEDVIELVRVDRKSGVEGLVVDIFCFWLMNEGRNKGRKGICRKVT